MSKQENDYMPIGDAPLKKQLEIDRSVKKVMSFTLTSESISEVLCPSYDQEDVCPMTFHSILFEQTDDSIKEETVEAPDFFVDLNLDQIIEAITAGKQEYNLKPFFYTPLNETDAIKYRHEIMQDLEDKVLFEHIRSFSKKMRTMREHLVKAEISNCLHSRGVKMSCEKDMKREYEL